MLFYDRKHYRIKVKQSIIPVSSIDHINLLNALQSLNCRDSVFFANNNIGTHLDQNPLIIDLQLPFIAETGFQSSLGVRSTDLVDDFNNKVANHLHKITK